MDLRQFAINVKEGNVVMGNLRRNARDLGTLAIGLSVVVFFWTFPACFEKKQSPRNDLPSMEQDNRPAPSTGRKPTARF